MAGFKTYQRGTRNLTVEESFALGMNFTNTPLGEGYCKTMINYDIKDLGKIVTPRKGYREISRSPAGLPANIHHSAVYAQLDETLLQDTYCKTALLCDEDAGNPVLLREVSPDVTEVLSINDNNNEIKRFGKLYPYALLNGVPILPVKNGARAGLAKLELTSNILKPLTADLNFIEPQVISPTEAMTYGYNMLNATPYAFQDEETATGMLSMEGILPYTDDTCTKLQFNAKSGGPITFRLFVKYPPGGKKYKFKWEIRELNSDLLDEYGTFDTEYDFSVAGTKVTLSINLPYKQNSISVTAYCSDNYTEPVQTMTLGAYNETAANQKSLDVRNYQLDTATNMCLWKQRLVLWGISGATNMVFISDVNNPSYFPYPNNSEILEGEIVACVPYLNDLLVFCTNKLYRLVWGLDGLSFTSKIIQENLFMSKRDSDTIVIVQNMVFFRNGTYFYMVVPKSSLTDLTALQLAPISTPITTLLDDLQENIEKFFQMLYNPNTAAGFPLLKQGEKRSIFFQDYHNYLDNSVVRNVYKFKYATGADAPAILYFDYMLCYDTMSRAWTSYIVQTGPGRLLPYTQSVTDDTVYITSVDGQCIFVKPDKTNPKDSFLLPAQHPRLLHNHQLIDTGYREHGSNTKKRYREMQFKVNNVSQKNLIFGNSFMIDDQVRKDLFRYETQLTPEGFLYVEPVYDDLSVAHGAALLEDTEDLLYIPVTYVTDSEEILLTSKNWTLGVSSLSEVSAIKIRLKVSGKGYAPRFILASLNEELYELMSLNWVYRLMNAR